MIDAEAKDSPFDCFNADDSKVLLKRFLIFSLVFEKSEYLITLTRILLDKSSNILLKKALYFASFVPLLYC